MSWTMTEVSWNKRIAEIHDRWPLTDAGVLSRIKGNKSQFTLHLAASYELTLAEAHEAIEDWMFFLPRGDPTAAAA